jgi:transposase InsO family protein
VKSWNAFMSNTKQAGVRSAHNALLLAVTLDLFNREVVGWPVKPRITTELVTDALTMAWLRRRHRARCAASFG